MDPTKQLGTFLAITCTTRQVSFVLILWSHLNRFKPKFGRIGVSSIHTLIHCIVGCTGAHNESLHDTISVNMGLFTPILSSSSACFVVAVRSEKIRALLLRAELFCVLQPCSKRFITFIVCVCVEIVFFSEHFQSAYSPAFLCPCLWVKNLNDSHPHIQSREKLVSKSKDLKCTHDCLSKVVLSKFA